MDKADQACIFAGLITVGYLVYVVVTKADGLVFGTFCTVIAGIGGYVIGRPNKS